MGNRPNVSVSVETIAFQAKEMGFVLRAEGMFDRPELNHSEFISDMMSFVEHRWSDEAMDFVYEENNLRLTVGFSLGKVSTDGTTTFIQPYVSSVEVNEYNHFISASCDYDRLAKILRKVAKIDEYAS